MAGEESRGEDGREEEAILATFFPSLGILSTETY